jgi:signal transduction histidine kinase
MTWQIGLVANSIIAVAYLGICAAIALPLARSGQLRTNPLGAATSAIFLTCAVHHGAHSVHMLLPTFGLDDTQGLAMRTAWGWPLALWDIVGAIVATYYWTLRRHYGSLMQGAQLFQDLRQREQQALELNDAVLQGLVVAKMALDLEQPRKANEALSASIESASRIITELLGSSHASLDLLRSVPAAAGGPAEHGGGAGAESSAPAPKSP